MVEMKEVMHTTDQFFEGSNAEPPMVILRGGRREGGSYVFDGGYRISQVRIDCRRKAKGFNYLRTGL